MNHISARSILWTAVQEKISIANSCEIAAIRPYMKFLMQHKMNNEEPFRDFQHFLNSEGLFKGTASYHKACQNAYFNGTMNTVSTITLLRGKLIFS